MFQIYLMLFLLR